MAARFHYERITDGFDPTVTHERQLEQAGFDASQVAVKQRLIVSEARLRCTQQSGVDCETDELPHQLLCGLDYEAEGGSYGFLCFRSTDSESERELLCSSPSLPGDCTDHLLRTLGLSVDES